MRKMLVYVISALKAVGRFRQRYRKYMNGDSSAQNGPAPSEPRRSRVATETDAQVVNFAEAKKKILDKRSLSQGVLQ